MDTAVLTKGGEAHSGRWRDTEVLNMVCQGIRWRVSSISFFVFPPDQVWARASARVRVHVCVLVRRLRILALRPRALGEGLQAGAVGEEVGGVTPAATVDSDASRLLLLLLLLLLLPPHLQVAAAAGFCLRGEAVLRTLQRRCCGRVACR